MQNFDYLDRDGAIDQIQMMQKRIDELESEVAKLEPDAKRWRWCESNVAETASLFATIDYEGGDVQEAVDNVMAGKRYDGS